MTECKNPTGGKPAGLFDAVTERTLSLSYLLQDCKSDCEDGPFAGTGARYYGSPLLNPKLSPALTSGMREAIRKAQLFEQVSLYLSAQRQAGRLSDMLTYAGQNHTPAAIADVSA